MMRNSNPISMSSSPSVFTDTNSTNTSSSQTVNLSFKNRHGQTIEGILRLVSKSHLKGFTEIDIIVFSHGLFGDRNAFFFEELAIALPCSTFRFDYPLFLSDNKTFRYAAFEEDTEDLKLVIRFLEKTQNLRVVGLLGHSRGGSVIIHYASQFYNPRLSHLKFIISVSSRAVMSRGPKLHLKLQLDEIEEKGFFIWNVRVRGDRIPLKITKEMVEEFCAATPLEDAKRLSHMLKILLVHGTEDKMVPFDDGVLFSQAIPHAIFHSIDGADHIFTQHKKDLIKVVIDWLKRLDIPTYTSHL